MVPAVLGHGTDISTRLELAQGFAAAAAAAARKIVLRPALNGSVSKLSTLSHSNHTLSPYTRTLEHFAVRSGPPRADGGAGASQGKPLLSAVERALHPVKARRKRTHRIDCICSRSQVA